MFFWVVTPVDGGSRVLRNVDITTVCPLQKCINETYFRASW